MATIKDFRDLKCWQEARILAKEVYSKTGCGRFSKDYGLKDQVQRAAVSIGSNIAEGFERDSNQDFLKFLSYAKGSVGEVISQFYTAYDVGYVSVEDLEDMVVRLKSIAAKIARLQYSIRSSGVKGLYHKKPETTN